MPLDRLPTELIQQILRDINISNRDICSIARVDRALHHIATILLYRDIELDVKVVRTGQHSISTNIRQLQAAVRIDPSKAAVVRILTLTWTNDAHPFPAICSVESESDTNCHGIMPFESKNLTAAGVEETLGYVPMIEIVRLVDHRISAPRFLVQLPELLPQLRELEITAFSVNYEEAVRIMLLPRLQKLSLASIMGVPEPEEKPISANAAQRSLVEHLKFGPHVQLCEHTAHLFKLCQCLKALCWTVEGNIRGSRSLDGKPPHAPLAHVLAPPIQVLSNSIFALVAMFVSKQDLRGILLRSIS